MPSKRELQRQINNLQAHVERLQEFTYQQVYEQFIHLPGYGTVPTVRGKIDAVTSHLNLDLSVKPGTQTLPKVVAKKVTAKKGKK